MTFGGYLDRFSNILNFNKESQFYRDKKLDAQCELAT